MGMSIDVHVYKKSKLEKEIQEKFGSNNSATLIKALNEFGILHEDTFVLQGADVWEDYSPWSEFIQMIECLNNKVDGYELLKKAEVGWKYDGANAYDVYNKLTGKELPPHPDDEE